MNYNWITMTKDKGEEDEDEDDEAMQSWGVRFLFFTNHISYQPRALLSRCQAFLYYRVVCWLPSVQCRRQIQNVMAIEDGSIDAFVHFQFYLINKKNEIR